MSDNAQNNKRIAKNTILLYFRMLLIMAINLYTSRVILQALGVEDYGIYNAVGGIIAIFNIIRGSLSTATQRFITHALGTKNKEYLNKVFSTSIFMHIALCIIILLLAETAGLWLLENKMIIPAGREVAAIWVYQCSIVSSLILIMSIPYNATIIAHEKMGAFALISLVEVFLKLGIVYLLLIFSTDKLILYSILMVVIQLIIRFCYTQYCIKNFKETKIHFVKDKKLIKEISMFSTWSIMGNAAYVSCTQGLNILLNMFFSPVVNAARGIAVQIQSAVWQFVMNFQTAFNPQITKSYASGDLGYMHRLVFTSSRFSFYLIFIISLPILIECETILHIWLGIVPEYTVTFSRIVLITCWINAVANPLIVSVKATGNIKTFELIIGIITILTLPISYVFLKFGYPPYSVFVINLVIEILAHIFRIWITSRLISFSIRKFIKEVILRCVIVTTIAVPAPILLHLHLEHNINSFITVCTVSVITSCLTVYTLGLQKNEKKFINRKVTHIFSKIRKI